MKSTKFIASAVLALTLVAGAAAPAFGVVANADFQDETSSNFGTASDPELSSEDSEPLVEEEPATSESSDTETTSETTEETSSEAEETNSEEETPSTPDTSSETITTGALDTASYGLTQMGSLAELMNAGTVSTAEASAFFQANFNALAAYGYRVIVVLSVDTTNYTAQIAYLDPTSASVATRSVNAMQLAQEIPDLGSYVILYRQGTPVDSSSVDDSSSVADSSSVTDSSSTASSSVTDTSSLVADSSSVASAAESSSTGSVQDTTSSNNSTGSTGTASSSSQASTSSNAVAKTGVGAATPVAAVLGASTVLTAALVLTAKKRKNEE